MYIYLFLISTVIISGLSVLLLKIGSKSLKLLLSFSGAYLFAISLLHLLPETYLSGGKSIGIYILMGFIIQIMLEFLSEGIEHGHVHEHDHHEHRFPLTMMTGLAIHSFLEGMPLANDTGSGNYSLLYGIILHNIPISIALMSMLLHSGIRKATAIGWLILFALVTPAGMLTASLLGSNLVEYITAFQDKVMGVVIGIFLHISTTILFESSENHRFNLIKFITILMGAILAWNIA